MGEQETNWDAYGRQLGSAGMSFEEAARSLGEAMANFGHAYYGGHYFQRQEGGRVACAVCDRPGLRPSPAGQGLASM